MVADKLDHRRPLSGPGLAWLSLGMAPGAVSASWSDGAYKGTESHAEIDERREVVPAVIAVASG